MKNKTNDADSETNVIYEINQGTKKEELIEKILKENEWLTRGC